MAARPGLATDVGCFVFLRQFAVRMIKDDVALVTHCSEVQYGEKLLRANRSSVWRRGIAGWLREFHQGTPIHVVAQPDHQSGSQTLIPGSATCGLD